MQKLGLNPPTTEKRQEADLLARLDALEQKLDTIDYEWTEWYDKFRRLHARLAKREEREHNGQSGQLKITNPAAAAILGRQI